MMKSRVGWITLTQYSEKGLGGLDRHGEERAGVQALIRQADVTDSDGELLPRCSHQLDPVIPQSCMAERKVKKERKTTFGGGRASATSAFIHFECVTRAANARCGRCFKESLTLHLHSRLAPAHLHSARMETTPRDALKCVGREKPIDYNIYRGNRSHSRY